MKKPRTSLSTISIDRDIYASLSQFCEDKGLKIKWVVENLVENYLAKELKK
jgi:hypothetical protein